MTPTVPASVVVPTIGRPGLLQALLESLVRCQPLPAEIVVVDQSGDDATARVVKRFADAGARLVACAPRGPARAMNVGLTAAQHEAILFIDDDCTVARDWAARAADHVERDPEAIATGRVLPAGDPRAVPSVKDDDAPHDYTGEVSFSVLYSGNMAVGRSAALGLGGFDERLLTAYDNDFCYRWLRAGRALRYDPAMVVWHCDWRTPDELVELYVAYARGQGAFYAKHLRGGDFGLLRYVGRDLYAGVRSLATVALRGTPRWADPRRGILRGLPTGLLEGWRTPAPDGDRSNGRADLALPR
ncbi:MAG TPA: glycosyltransferase family A protein [Gaiellaceae bacterium]|nr:glycosyltransferase family A protein [Gaiellaceae bacterium]